MKQYGYKFSFPLIYSRFIAIIPSIDTTKIPKYCIELGTIYMHIIVNDRIYANA